MVKIDFFQYVIRVKKCIISVRIFYFIPPEYLFIAIAYYKGKNFMNIPLLS